jgi:cobalt/nickel transport system permease protein
VLAAGAVVAAGAVGLALRRLDETQIPRTAILAAVFFTTSLIAVPVGPSSIHLLLSGLMGLILGTLTFPAVLIGLLLQSTLFGFGGITTLGINTVNIALPGVLLAAAVAPTIARATPPMAAVVAGITAALAIAATGLLVSLSLALSSPDYVPTAKILIATYLPLMLIEALVTGFCIMFLKRVKPEMFGAVTGAT